MERGLLLDLSIYARLWYNLLGAGTHQSHWSSWDSMTSTCSWSDTDRQPSEQHEAGKTSTTTTTQQWPTHHGRLEHRSGTHSRTAHWHVPHTPVQETDPDSKTTTHTIAWTSWLFHIQDSCTLYQWTPQHHYLHQNGIGIFICKDHILYAYTTNWGCRLMVKLRNLPLIQDEQASNSY